MKKSRHKAGTPAPQQFCKIQNKKHKMHIEREKHKAGTKVGSLIHQNAFQ